MTIGATVNPLLQQVGTLDEFKALGKPYNLVHVYIEGLQSNFVMDMTERAGM